MKKIPEKSISKPTSTQVEPNRRFCVAPMMDWSDKHCRYLWRLISRHALLYTEMVTTGALIHGDRERFLDYHACEHPVALQLGGSDPRELALCARMAEDWGYDEVNLNCGCPSDRVQSGKIGACLMAEPERVAECIQAMQNAVSIPVTVKHRIGIDDNAVSIPVTVKHRIGIDDMEDYPGLTGFVRPIAATGCRTFIVHARKAWLQGLSPKENREIPPLQYAMVYRLKQDFPGLEVIINGGITTLEQCREHLHRVDGVMIGREAYHNPYLLAQVDGLLYSDDRPAPDRQHILEMFAAYCGEQIRRGTRLNHMSRHVLGLFQGIPGARRFRRHISEHAHRPDANENLLIQALATVDAWHTGGSAVFKDPKPDD